MLERDRFLPYLDMVCLIPKPNDISSWVNNCLGFFLATSCFVACVKRTDPPCSFQRSETSNNRWITTLAARFGVTNGPWLFYGKAGGGWVGNDDFTINNLTTGTSITASNNNTNSGWLLGAGIEWAFAPNWSAKVEYNYLGLDDRTFIVPAGVPGFLPGDTFTQSNRNIQMVKVGINYLFNWSSYRY